MNASQENQVDIDPVHYASQIFDISFNEESFYLTVTSGKRGRIYVLAPKHAKRLYLLLKKHIREYEEKYGELKTELPKKNPSATASQSAIGFAFTHEAKPRMKTGIKNSKKTK